MVLDSVSSNINVEVFSTLPVAIVASEESSGRRPYCRAPQMLGTRGSEARESLWCVSFYPLWGMQRKWPGNESV